jgi:transposase
VHIKAESSHVVRAELATRTLLVRMRCDLENQIRGVLKTFSLVIGKAPSRLVRRAHEIVADELAAKPELASLVKSLLAMRANIAERIAELDARLRELAKTSPVCRRFMTVPGIGPLTALAVSAGIDDQERFVRSRDVGAYFGLTPRRYASGEMSRSGRITRRGDGTVRTLLYEAANVLLVKISRSSALRSWGLAIAQRSGFKKAKVAVARKLAVLLHRLWRDGSEFRWSTATAAA